MLKEVLDRIELPLPEDVPGLTGLTPSQEASGSLDAAAATGPIEEWTIPRTDITIRLVAEGARKGEFLFASDTVRRVPRFFERVRHLPYKDNATPGIFRAYFLTPGEGLDLRWNQTMPSWGQAVIFGQAVWQWGATLLALVLAGLAIRSLLWFAERLDHRFPGEPALGGRRRWHPARLVALTASFALLLFIEWLIDEGINLTGDPLDIVLYVVAFASYVFLCWLAALVVMQLAELAIHSRKLQPSAARSQLIRLVGLVVAGAAIVAILVNAGHEFGLPAYSMVTGFGIGGLAVTLSAQEVLKDIFGSIVIMWERPYRIGHDVVIGDHKGTVEAIGYRSTRLRSEDDTVVVIPNADAAGATVENLGLRSYRRIKTTLSIDDATPPEQIEAFLEGIKLIVQANPCTRKDKFDVVIFEFGAAGLDILLSYFLVVPDKRAELVERHRILLEVIRLAEALGVAFAPTQTTWTQTTNAEAMSHGEGAPSADELRRIAESFGKGEQARSRGLGIFVPPSEESSTKT